MGGKKGGIGAVVGTAVAGPLGGLIGGGLGMSMDGSDRAARAAGRAAEAQMGEARRQRDEARQMTEEVTVQGLMQYDKALDVQHRNIARQEQMISQIDPTIIEASQQALKLLRGEQSSALAPLQKNRDMQRQKLLNQLREQLGPGAETSSMGQQALSRFDSETTNLMAGGQQQALANLGNVFGQFNSGRPDMLREASGLGALATNKQGLRLGQLGAMSGANQQMFQTAGGQYAGDQLRGQYQQAMGNQLTGAGLQIGTSLISGMMGGGAKA